MREKLTFTPHLYIGTPFLFVHFMYFFLHAILAVNLIVGQLLLLV